MSFFLYNFNLDLNKLSGNKKTEEEKIGSKVIQWTPFPTPPKNLIDFSKLESASQKMTTFKIFPVNNKILKKHSL